MARRREPADKHAAFELQLFVENDGQLYRQQEVPIRKNLCRRKKKGTYDYKKSIKLFSYLIESGAKKYHKDLGPSRPGQKWYEMFNVATREEAAKIFAKDFRDNWKEYC